MQGMSPRRIFTALALFLSGCAGAPQSYPSLAKRPIENAPIAEIAPPPAPAAADPALQSEIARYAAQADKGATAFNAAYAKAEKAVAAARNAGVSSEAWVDAQVAISALEVLVAVIQAYVFALLTSVYLNDAENLH
jgi:hypothetical protein